MPVAMAAAPLEEEAASVVAELPIDDVPVTCQHTKIAKSD